MKILNLIISVLTLILAISCNVKTDGYRSISPDVLKDKIAGGWAGKMVGVTYGAPTEFRAQGKIYSDSIKWKPQDIRGSMWQDDIYVQLTFLMTMDKYGIDAPSKKYQEMFAKAGYALWHANMQARKNWYDSIFAPLSGTPEYNIHADDIDFQIEADYIGFMCPAMPATATVIADKIGRIMNFGDGVYGGIYVAALYAEAFFEKDIKKVVEKALLSIPAESDYAAIVRDVIKLHEHYPTDWQAAWNEIEVKYGDIDICGAGSTFNIDAKLNGAYIVMGLLYGEGDPMKTLEISTRCGQDSDCNPSNALAVLGVINGFSGLPQNMQDGVMAMADSTFIHTTYTFKTAVESTYRYAQNLISKEGGEIKNKRIMIKIQEPAAPQLEVAFPDVVFDRYISIFEKDTWKMKGRWQEYEQRGRNNPARKQAMWSDKAGDEIELTFTGTGIAISGNWFRDGGKADVYLDGKLHRSIDTYYYFARQQHTETMWHALGLEPGGHTLRIVVKGEKRPEAEGSRVYITGARIFKTEPKKNENFKFSFE